jgi:hypothetical protein
MLHDDEKIELAERVSTAKHAWLFVFKPNDDLLADSNAIIARVM